MAAFQRHFLVGSKWLEGSRDSSTGKPLVFQRREVMPEHARRGSHGNPPIFAALQTIWSISRSDLASQFLSASREGHIVQGRAPSATALSSAAFAPAEQPPSHR